MWLVLCNDPCNLRKNPLNFCLSGVASKCWIGFHTAEHSRVVAVAQMSSVWFTGGRFGVSLYVDTLIVYPPENAGGPRGGLVPGFEGFEGEDTALTVDTEP